MRFPKNPHYGWDYDAGREFWRLFPCPPLPLDPVTYYHANLAGSSRERGSHLR